MGCYKEEYVVVRSGLKPCDPSEITINCPDKVGLGFDLARIVFEFGLYVTKGDFSTDGRWCFVVIWVKPLACPSTVYWSLLKQRLEDICPFALAPCWLPLAVPPVPESERILLLQFSSPDRTGLLHGVIQKLGKMELTIHKVEVSTSPDGIAVDCFFVTDNRTKLPWSKRRAEELKSNLENYLEDAYSVCEVHLAGAEYGVLSCFPLPASLTREIFCDDPATFEQADHTISGKAHNRAANPVVVTVDNNTSPVHSLLQISCKSRKGLLYDCLRTVKDLNFKVAHGRIPNVVRSEKGNSELCLFVQDSHGRKITDVQEQKVLVQCMEVEVRNPIRIKVQTIGTDTELLVATPIEKGGRGRPGVLYDVTQALNIPDISIFSAEVGRHECNDKRWEIYRFLLVDKEEPSLTCSQIRNRIVDRVRQGLLGCIMQPDINLSPRTNTPYSRTSPLDFTGFIARHFRKLRSLLLGGFTERPITNSASITLCN